MNQKLENFDRWYNSMSKVLHVENSKTGVQNYYKIEPQNQQICKLNQWSSIFLCWKWLMLKIVDPFSVFHINDFNIFNECSSTKWHDSLF
jgi:hypothetical protein